MAFSVLEDEPEVYSDSNLDDDEFYQQYENPDTNFIRL